ncbi:unnamed protein product [Rotaria socialis]|uniref:Uncharacterized protein n=5 Tax=Rotaria socialis TaxID=392032 RepID=A0A817V303_9BILA|nr:unnamed protein product [Rotaria socialis]CAF3341114.1 unnamed protein product [Rotaria socialis]CAF3464940.1 unnamed protein product [Rotaria socialis]CAF4429146.1 unnamed protein product [Rotaria socialis]CAF4444937.1 unnamed protein product [Rotaria socialis]
MLTNNQPPAGGPRHNYIRLGFLVGTLLLFIVHILVNEFFGNGNCHPPGNGTIHAEALLANDITPSDWVYRSLNGLNYIWQLSWLLYSLTFIYRRSSTAYLYVSPSTLSPMFYIIYNLAFLIPTIWIVWFQKSHSVWTWVVYLVSFLLLSFDLFIINNNLVMNEKIYETDGFKRDIWILRFFAQNGVAFFACWTAVRFVVSFDTFLQIRLTLSIVNAGTIALVLAGIIAFAYFFGPNLNAALVEKCAYQFAPWIVFLIFFWGIVEGNWHFKYIKRNFVIGLLEFLASLISAIIALALFSMRYRASKRNPIP